MILLKTIVKNVENELIIKKSKFITKLYKIECEEEIKKILIDLKKEYKDCTHICYGYIINNTKRFNDNNEPSGTAGMPILKLIEVNDLNYILCVVIRYFGGIKLGASGLIRAYSNSVNEALKLTQIIELNEGKIIQIEFHYDKIKSIDNLLKDVLIISKDFDNNIIYEFKIENNAYIEIYNELKNLCINLYEKGITLI